MATSKPISSISYNTELYLVSKLTRLVESGIISFWAYIHHNGEEKTNDEAAGKDHIHLLMIPNRCVDLVAVGKQFQEFYPNDPQRPLRCMPFRTSKTDDWIMYALHDPDYLAFHGMEKTYVYDVVDFVASDEDYLHQLWVEARQSLHNNPAIKIRRKAKEGVSFTRLVQSGAVSIQQIRNAELYYGYFVQDSTSAKRAMLSFDDGMLILPNGDVKWESEVFGDEPE